MNDLLNFMPVYYVDGEKDQTVKMNKQLKQRVKRTIKEDKKENKEQDVYWSNFDNINAERNRERSKDK